MRDRTSRVDVILTKMFEMVDDVYSPSLNLVDDWYKNNTWSEEQQNEFRVWLIGYYRKEYKVTLREAKRNADMFIFNYGWSIK